MDKILVGKRIKHYRHLTKMSQETLADIVGLSDTYIRKMEAGQRTPSLGTIMALSRALNTTPDHFLLSTTSLGKGQSSGILDLLKDCTPTEFVILYENMIELKELLRMHLK